MPIIVQPVADRTHPQNEDLVRALAMRPGYRLLRSFGSLGVDRVRSHLASQALAIEPLEEWWFWIDTDMVSEPHWVDMLFDSAVKHNSALMSAVTVCRKSHEPNVRISGTLPVHLGDNGSVMEIEKGAFAFAWTHRRLFEEVAKGLPEVDYKDDGTGEVLRGWPFFSPIIRNRIHYGEDYSMSLRARDAGLRLYADTRVRNWHASEELLGWEHMNNAEVQEMEK